MGGDIINYLQVNKLKKVFLIYSITFLAASYYYNNYISNNDIDYKTDDKAFAKYSKGLVYIGDNSFLNSIDANRNDILVEDQRDLENPSMKIINSYMITNSKTRQEILKILCEYEKKYPSNWDRSIGAMDLEWETHNILYYLNYKKDHTTDVDLDNNDEEKYKKLLKP